MPVTVRFSSKFYERLGDDVAGELVDWCNAVDETYRNQLREMNESFWERLTTHLDASLGVTRNEMSTMRGDLRNEIATTGADLRNEVASTRADLRTEMSGVRADLRAEMGKLGSDLRTEMGAMGADLRTEMGTIGANLRTAMGNMGADFRIEIANTRAELIKWMFVFWIGNVASLGGLIVGLHFFGGK